MRRASVLFGAGALLGAVAMYLARSGDEAPSASSPAIEARDSAPIPSAQAQSPRAIDFLTLATGSVSLTERAALFSLAAEADRRTLETLATQVAALPDIEGRRLALEALFTRYVEIDAPAAAAFAATLDLPTAALVPLYETWARRDARGALAALGELEGPAALTLGIAVLDALGNDDLGIARVLGAAPQIDADRFRIEAAVAKAATNPQAALDDVLLLPPTKAGASFERIAAAWIERDVHGALAAAEEIADEEMRTGFRASVIRAWTRIDPDAVVDYVLGLDPERRLQTMRVGGAAQAFALVDPQRALQAADGLPGEMGSMIRRAALMSLARDDPRAAINAIETVMTGDERQQLLTAIAASYGRTDPDAALAWAQSLNPPAPNVVANVLSGLAREDPDRAIDLYIDLLDNNPNRPGVGVGFMPFLAGTALDGANTAKLADRLLATPNRGQALQMTIQQWTQRQPHEAIRWLVANGNTVPRSAFGQAASQLARNDPAAAIAYVDTVPSNMRATWLSSVADGYSQRDPRSAANWIAQYQGQAGYDAAVAAIAGRTAATDPVAAARLFDSINVAEAPDAPQTSQRIANAWTQRDVRTAAGWAAAIPDEQARAAAVGAVAAQWVERDPAATRSWTLGLPSGAARDSALTAVLGRTAGSTIDPVLLDGFSTSQAKETAVGIAARTIAARDPAAARQLADQHITDPNLRRSVDRFIEQGGAPFGVSTPRLPPGR
jgi:hypothetical protein